MAEVLMPRLSDSMEEGTILSWLKADGDEVARGDELVEIETDKANMVYEAEESGALTILVPEGETVAVGAPIATIGDVPATAKQVASTAAAPATPEPDGPSIPPPLQPAASNRGDGRISVSPVAQRAAASLGVTLEGLTGSGPRGRILKRDVLRAAEAAVGLATGGQAAEEPTLEPSAKGEVTVIELSRTQRTVARRMAESKATIPQFPLTIEVDVTALLALGNDINVRATARALRVNPRVNGAYVDGRFELYQRVNIGIAVAAEDALVVPVIRDADKLTFPQLWSESRRLAERVRAGAVTASELAGGTFTVSNLGMYGVTSFAGIINPPQAAILCVGAARDQVVLGDEGQAVACRMMELTLVSDHRILYGADAAEFLAALRDLLERPLRLLV